jgi:Reverse transcriptase (RNA-dependent DNA polymerase)
MGTGRQACIILEDELLTEFFELNRGNAQGDTISPFCFNLGYQILLFKLNFDLQILGGIEVPSAPPEDDCRLPGSASIFNTKTKVMAMADDATCITKMDVSSLTRIKNILKKFGEMSGLECNVEKTTLLPLTTEPVPVNITNLGFEIKDEFTILGMLLNNKGDFLEKNANVITEKICRQINFWNRFCLSLPGRIAICKAMLY